MELALVLKLSPENRTPRVELLVRRHLESKLAKIEARWGKPITARVVADEQPVGFNVSVALLGEHEVVARAFDEKLPKAVDAAIDKLTRQFEILTQKREGRERNRRTPNNRLPAEF